jgi:hypothetical protein
MYETTQVGFGELFEEMIWRVNRDYEFNLTGNPITASFQENDLVYEEGAIDRIDLYFGTGSGRHVERNFPTTFVIDAERSLDLAKLKLEQDLRRVLNEFKVIQSLKNKI